MSNYTLFNLIGDLSLDEREIINKFPLLTKEQWSDARYESIKQRVKGELILYQLDRCAYCRKIIEADAKYEPLEHIVAKSICPSWMLEPKNLIVTCDSCNNLKGTDPVVTPEVIASGILPNTSDAYIIFNPHFDTWDEHLIYEDDIFLVAIPNSKGNDTVRICKLYRYNVILNRAKDLKLLQKEPMGKILNRLRIIDYSSPESKILSEQLHHAMDHYIKRVNDDPRY